jgi:hypothetical protein
MNSSSVAQNNARDAKSSFEGSGLSESHRDRFDRSKMPLGIQRLTVDTRGYPVPWFVDKAAPYVNGNPDFRIMDGAHLKLAIRERRCWVCGMKLRDGPFAFLAGPMCGINRNNAEPPCHIECARWSAVACPFLSHPKRIRDTRDLPTSRSQAGVGIKRNPGVAMVWVCDDYETWRPPGGGVLFDLPDPLRVEWFCEGREATRAEVMESVETGLPLLLEPAARESPVACFELGRMTERFLALLPAGDQSREDQ